MSRPQLPRKLSQHITTPSLSSVQLVSSPTLCLLRHFIPPQLSRGEKSLANKESGKVNRRSLQHLARGYDNGASAYGEESAAATLLSFAHLARTQPEGLVTDRMAESRAFCDTASSSELLLCVLHVFLASTYRLGGIGQEPT